MAFRKQAAFQSPLSSSLTRKLLDSAQIIQLYLVSYRFPVVKTTQGLLMQCGVAGDGGVSQDPSIVS